MNNEGIKSSSKAVTSELNYELKPFFQYQSLSFDNGDSSAQMVLKNIRGLTAGSSESIFQKVTDIICKKAKIYLFLLANVACVAFHNAMLQIGNGAARTSSSRRCKEFCMYICMSRCTFLAKGLQYKYVPEYLQTNRLAGMGLGAG